MPFKETNSKQQIRLDCWKKKRRKGGLQEDVIDVVEKILQETSYGSGDLYGLRELHSHYLYLWSFIHGLCNLLGLKHVLLASPNDCS